MKSLVILGLAGLSCGGGHGGRPDASGGKKDAAIDAPMIPPVPTLGAQIDRMGRPAINTALNGTFLPAGMAKTAQKDAYNHAADPATWLTTQVKTNTTIVQELAANLAIFDVLDQGTAITGAGCGNAALYTAPPSTTSYTNLAKLLADDALYVDTAKASSKTFLALELEFATQAQIVHDDAGGRAPSYDVMDFTYSLLAAGTNGFSISGSDITPKVTDGVGPHTDVDDMMFPFLGPPH